VRISRKLPPADSAAPFSMGAQFYAANPSVVRSPTFTGFLYLLSEEKGLPLRCRVNV